MTHAPETGAVNSLHFSGAGLWYVCHANLGPDSSGTRFWCWLKQFWKWRARDWNDDLWLVDDNCWRFKVSWSCSMQCCYLIIYLIFSDVYLWCQKFSFQTHRHWKSTSSVFTRFTTAVLITELKYRYLYYTNVYSLVIVISEFRTLLDCRQNFIYIRIFNFHRPRKRQTCRPVSYTHLTLPTIYSV